MADQLDVTNLKTQHQDLETAIEDERNRPMPDASILSSLKKQKLRIKDEIERLIHV